MTLKDLHLSKYLPAADQVQRRAENCVHLRNPDGRGESDHWPGHLQANPGALDHHPARRIRDGAMGALPAHPRLLRILPGSRDPGGPGGLEQLPQHGERPGSEAHPRSLARSRKKELDERPTTSSWHDRAGVSTGGQMARQSTAGKPQSIRAGASPSPPRA